MSKRSTINEEAGPLLPHTPFALSALTKSPCTFWQWEKKTDNPERMYQWTMEIPPPALWLSTIARIEMKSAWGGGTTS